MPSTFDELGGRIHYLRRLVNKENKLWSAFNPSIAHSPEHGYAVAIRSSNFVLTGDYKITLTGAGGFVKNHVWFAELDEDLGLHNLRQIDFSRCGYEFRRGVDDPKLLWRNGRWMFTGVALEKNIPIARHCECYINKDVTEVEKVIFFEGVEKLRPEKNWMTAPNKPANFDYVYDGNGVIKDGILTKKMRDVTQLSGLRGNSHLVEQQDGTYLAIMHQTMTNKHEKNNELVIRKYKHFLVRIDENGWVVEVSDPFCFIAPGVEFAAGMVQKDDELIVSFGKRDESSHCAIIDAAKFKSTLKKIGKY